LIGKVDGEFFGHTTEDGFVDVSKTVSGAENHDLFWNTVGGGREQAIPEGHEFGFDHVGGFVIIGAALSEHGVDLVDEDYARLEFAREGEDSGDDLVAIAVILFGQSRDVKVDEASFRLFGECFGEHCLATTGRTVEEDAFGGREQRAIGGEKLGLSEGEDYGLAEVLDDAVEAADVIEAN
jgi:hypothetical protein